MQPRRSPVGEATRAWHEPRVKRTARPWRLAPYHVTGVTPATAWTILGTGPLGVTLTNCHGSIAELPPARHTAATQAASSAAPNLLPTLLASPRLPACAIPQRRSGPAQTTSSAGQPAQANSLGRGGNCPAWIRSIASVS